MTLDWLVLSGALLTGLLGGAHCAAMCGGIATGLSVGQRSGWWIAAQPNLGRIAGYTIAGAPGRRHRPGGARRRATAVADRRFARGGRDRAGPRGVAPARSQWALVLPGPSGRTDLATLAAVAAAPAAGGHHGQTSRAWRAVGLDALRPQYAVARRGVVAGERVAWRADDVGLRHGDVAGDAAADLGGRAIRPAPATRWMARRVGDGACCSRVWRRSPGPG